MKVVIVGAVAGADQRINALAMANRMGATIDDVAESELCYAPQFGSANDPLNVAAMMARHILGGDMPVAPWSARGEGLLLDMWKHRNWRSNASLARSTSRSNSCAAGSRNCPGTASSRSSAAPASAPTTQRGCCCRTASARGPCRVACCHAPCSSLAPKGSVMRSTEALR